MEIGFIELRDNVLRGVHQPGMIRDVKFNSFSVISNIDFFQVEISLSEIDFHVNYSIFFYFSAFI